MKWAADEVLRSCGEEIRSSVVWKEGAFPPTTYSWNSTPMPLHNNNNNNSGQTQMHTLPFVLPLPPSLRLNRTSLLLHTPTSRLTTSKPIYLHINITITIKTEKGKRKSSNNNNPQHITL